jgi:hypothetical protein
MSPARERRRAGRGRRHRRAIRLAAWTWAVLLSPLLLWGLPSKRNDDLLGGRDGVDWQRVSEVARQRAAVLATRPAGADVDLDPLGPASEIVDLVPTTASRAEILLRYRLYSRQPDEMITFRALQGMRPRQFDFDPKLYQYGGAYIYSVGAALAASAAIGLTRVTSDVSYFIQNPEQFARFYLVARLVSLLFGAAALVAVARLAARAGGRAAAWMAFSAAALSPVFISGALEAKPHLPATALLLWATVAALEWLDTGQWRALYRGALLAGLSFGFVLTGLVGALLGVALLCIAPRGVERGAARRGALRALLLAAAVYAATNPYVAYNALFDRAKLASNLSNSTAMYDAGRVPEGAARVAMLLYEGVGPGVVAIGAIGLVVLLRRWPRQTLVALAPAAALVAICVAIGAGKPAEFGRFLALPGLLLCVAAGAVLAQLRRRGPLVSILPLAAVLLTTGAPRYLGAFLQDALGAAESRRLAGVFLARHMGDLDELAVVQEPAPYAIPPLDFMHVELRLLPSAEPPGLDPRELPRWLVLCADDSGAELGAWWRRYYRPVASTVPDGKSAKIAWANKPVFVYMRADGDADAATSAPGESEEP